MKERIIIRNGIEYPVVETRNVTAGEEAKGEYEQYKIRVKHDGSVSKFFIKPCCYWDDAIYAGSFHLNFSNDKITWFMWSDYDPVFIFVFKRLAEVLDGNDVLIVSVKRGRMIDRYRITINELRPLLGIGETKYGLSLVNKAGFEKLKSKVWSSAYAKKK